MRQQPLHPPAEYVDLDDFLWRDYSNRTDWASWVAQRYAIDIRAAGRQYAAAIELQEALRALQHVNNGADEDASAAARLDAMVARYGVRPAVRGDGSSTLVASGGPIADLLVKVLTALR